MVLIIHQQENEMFEAQFTAFLSNKREISQKVDNEVRNIIHSVRELGDEALFSYSLQFDRVDLRKCGILITKKEIDEAIKTVPSRTVEALQFSYDRILTYHKKQLPKDEYFTDSLGVELGWRWTAVESVGLYVPGGTANYPSSVLMSAVPAKVAGVERLVMVVPFPDGKLNPLVLVAAKLIGIDEIYRIGGAQAIAALAYGTKTIHPVVKIVGPGNAYVAAAKRQVFGLVGIDMIAGPSEILVVADKENNHNWIAADLLSQAEHDSSAQSILLTDCFDFSQKVSCSIEEQLKYLQRKKIAFASWENFGAIFLVKNIEAALPLINRIAPEHLELAVKDPEKLLAGIRNAGAIFLGCYTPEVIGDYVGGPNHVLPTARSARFSSPLSVLDYMKRSSLLKLGTEQFKKLAPTAIRLAKEEGLEAHARSAAIRFEK